jgi:hypothetical protein
MNVTCIRSIEVNLHAFCTSATGRDKWTPSLSGRCSFGERERTVATGEEFVWAYLDVTGKEISLPLSGIE